MGSTRFFQGVALIGGKRRARMAQARRCHRQANGLCDAEDEPRAAHQPAGIAHSLPPATRYAPVTGPSFPMTWGRVGEASRAAFKGCNDHHHPTPSRRGRKNPSKAALQGFQFRIRPLPGERTILIATSRSPAGPLFCGQPLPLVRKVRAGEVLGGIFQVDRAESVGTLTEPPRMASASRTEISARRFAPSTFRSGWTDTWMVTMASPG